MTTTYERNCDYCKRYYKSQGKYYCSKECRIAIDKNRLANWKKEHSFIKEINCKICNKLFKPYIKEKNKRRIYCSRKCYEKDRINNNQNSIKALNKYQETQRKATDEQLLIAWKRCKENPNLTYEESFKEFGYKRMLPKRLKKLIPLEEIKEMSKRRGYLQKGNSRYIRGRNAEYLVVKELASLGYHTGRTPGSKGLFDVIAFNKEELRLIQVKRTKDNSYHFPSKELKAIKDLYVPNNTRKELWIRFDKQKGRNAKWEKIEISTNIEKISIKC